MAYLKTARADARALVAGLVIGATIGLTLGGAYFAGGMARTADERAMALRGATRPDPIAMNALMLGAPEAVISTGSGKPLAATRVSVTPAEPFRPAAGAAPNAGRDLDCLTDAVYYEARGETPAGQAAVAQVVLNRVRHPAFPKSVCAVVFQGAGSGDKCQFSFVCNGAMRQDRDTAAWDRARRIAARALDGFVMPQVGEATHFHAVRIASGWDPSLTRVAQVGLHVFYRFGGHAGAASHFEHDARPSPSVADGSHTVLASMLPGLGDVHAATATAASAPATTAGQRAAGTPPFALRPSLSADPAAAPKADTATAMAKTAPASSVS